MGSRVVLLAFSVITLGIRAAAVPDVIAAAGPCQADNVMLGQAPGLTGATSTDWFNVFGSNFDGTVPATLTFDVPVIPWSIDQPRVVQPAVSTFVVPAVAMSPSFKWTFRTRDAGVQSVTVIVAGLGCEARIVVNLAPPTTSTTEPSTPSRPSPVTPLLFGLAFAGGVLVARRRFGHPL